MTRRMMACLLRARRNGTLPEQFRAADARGAMTEERFPAE